MISRIQHKNHSLDLKENDTTKLIIALTEIVRRMGKKKLKNKLIKDS